jgi:hypothetical protein
MDIRQEPTTDNWIIILTVCGGSTIHRDNCPCHCRNIFVVGGVAMTNKNTRNCPLNYAPHVYKTPGRFLREKKRRKITHSESWKLRMKKKKYNERILGCNRTRQRGGKADPLNSTWCNNTGVVINRFSEFDKYPVWFSFVSYVFGKKKIPSRNVTRLQWKVIVQLKIGLNAFYTYDIINVYIM